MPAAVLQEWNERSALLKIEGAIWAALGLVEIATRGEWPGIDPDNPVLVQIGQDLALAAESVRGELA